MTDPTSEVQTSLAATLKALPARPGVYLMKDEAGTVIYVGKAKRLRNRVRSYFSGEKDRKTSILVARVVDIDWIITETEFEALRLENTLIKRHSPRYNINLKDGKSYPVIRITREEFPRVFKTRRVIQDGSEYFGPFPRVASIDRYLDLVYRLYPLRRCRGPVKRREHACLYYHIGRCAAVCAGKTDQTEYSRRISAIRRLLSGDTASVLQEVEQQMEAAAAELQFERAAELRDLSSAVRDLSHEPTVVDYEQDSRDYIAWANHEHLTSFVVFQMRDGKLLGSDVFRAQVFGTADEDLEQFILQYYSTASWEAHPALAELEDQGADEDAAVAEDIPGAPRVRGDRWNPQDLALNIGNVPPARIVAEDFGATDELQRFFREQLESDVIIEAPESSHDRSILALARENARQDLERRIRETGNYPALEELRDALQLPSVPVRIEGFDISQLGGKHPVASLVSFHNGIPDKANYRRFNLKTLGGEIDDYAAMREAVARRYTRVVNEKKQIPDLVMVDGGKGQVSAAKTVLKALGLDSVPVVGLAKEEELLFLPDRDEPVSLPEGSPPLRVLQFVRDETHRFATGANKAARSRTLRTSILEQVPGIGPARAKQILTSMGSLDAIRDSDPQSLAARARIPVALAERAIRLMRREEAEDRAPAADDPDDE